SKKEFILPQIEPEAAIDVMIGDNEYKAYRYGADVYIVDGYNVIGIIKNCDIRVREDNSDESEAEPITFNVAKHKQVDASGIENPYDWLWDKYNGNIYYPVRKL